MNIVFMGTPDFAVAPLKALMADESGQWALKLVVTRPDSASARGKALLPSPVRVVADECGVPVITPRSFYLATPVPVAQRTVDAQLLNAIAATEPDFIVVAAFGLILPPEILDLPRFGCINIHGSLLPRWRGAAPIQRAILAGDEQLGVCIMRMEEGLDTGPYCATAETAAEGKNATELIEELSALGAQLLLEALPSIADGTARWTEQDDAEATYADKIEKRELALDPQDAAHINLRRVLASSTQAPSRCVIAGRPVTVLEARAGSSSAEGVPKDSHTGSAGAASFSNKQLLLWTTDGSLEVIALKPDGKNVMDARSFAAGIKELQKGGEGEITWQSVEAGGENRT